MRILPTCVAAAIVVSAAALSAQAPAPQAPVQQPAPPVFRAGVELLTLDVTALDNDTGRQVTDLAATDFIVEVDGGARQVTSSEYVRSVDRLRVTGAPRQVSVRADETYFSSNSNAAPSGRLIALLVDQGNIRTGAARQAMNGAKKFVDSLEPEDRVAVIAVPGPGELVDFTTDHDAVREALLRIVGRSETVQVQLNISVTEAIAIHNRTDARVAIEVVQRECAQAAGLADLDNCQRELEQAASEIVSDVRKRTDDSVRAMRAVLMSLGNLEGPKSVILVSEGLMFDGLGTETDDLAAVASDSRASLDVL